jgi:thioredoxin reductase
MKGDSDKYRLTDNDNTNNHLKTDQIHNNYNIIDDKKKQQDRETYLAFDVAIVGAGFAGLSAALLLGRYLRPTVIFDGGETRNHTSKHVHGYLGFENSSPKHIIQKAWKDVLQYDSIKVVKVKIDTIKMSDKKYFLLKTSESQERISVRSKYIIIATGIKDIKPTIKNFEKFDGNGAWHCPHCDGFQTTNKKLAIIALGQESISYAKEFLGWTKDITVFIQQGEKHDKCRLTDKDKVEAKALGIDLVENDSVIEIIGDQEGKPNGVICKSKRLYNAEVIFYHLGYDIQNEIAKQLGCELDDGHIKVNTMQQTTVPNVYAAGDIDTDRHYVVLAVASGALAAISIYEQMLKDAIRMQKTRT